MIPTDVFIDILRKTLSDNKSIYDYLQLILPFIGGITIALMSWFFSYRSNKQLFRQQIAKDKHQSSKEILLRIISLHSDFLAHFYQFIRDVRNRSLSDDEMDINDFEEFSSSCQTKYVYIEELIRIEFPDVTTVPKTILDQVDAIEESLREISRVRSGARINPEDLEKAVRALNGIFQRVANYTAQTDDQLIKSYLGAMKEIVAKD